MKMIEWFKSVDNKKCISCGSRRVQEEHFPDEDGWSCDDMTRKQWLFFHCLDCRYDTAIWKLGVGIGR